eukprot:3118042-Alexandrium_andersonii.AAC.1
MEAAEVAVDAVARHCKAKATADRQSRAKTARSEAKASAGLAADYEQHLFRPVVPILGAAL